MQEFVNVFAGRSEAPADSDVSAALGKAKAIWDGLLTGLASEYGLANGEWNSYSPKVGWSYRVKHKDRNIVYLSPGDGCFQASFVLGEKAMQAARDSGPSADLAAMLDNAPKYPEGRVIRLRVTGLRYVPSVKKLVAAKLAK